MRVRLLCTSLVCGLLMAAPSAFAGELRILDSMGLTRAVKSVHEQASVRVSTGGGAGAPGAVILSQVDGLAPDINPSKVSDSVVVFEQVPEGAWRIRISSPKVVISEVKIDQ